MMLEIPELDPELKIELTTIIDNKTFCPSKSKLNWETGILPKLITRLDQLSELSQQGNRFGKPKNVDLPETIKEINETIKRHLATSKTISPPFTIYRIAEMIMEPNSQGYNLIDNDQLLKYFNSLKKVFIVSSTVAEFPPVEICDEVIEEESKSTRRVANNISLVEIPWLITSEKDHNDSTITQKRKEPESVNKDDSNKTIKN